MTDDNKQRTLIYALGVTCFFQMTVLAPVLPRFAEEQLGLDVGATGLVLAARTLVPVLFAAGLGSWGVRIGLRRFMLWAAALTFVSGFLYFTATDFASLVVAQILGGTFHLAVWISVQTYATNMPDRARVVGVFSTFTAVGMALAPVAGGVSFDYGGYNASFAVYALVGFIQTLLITRLRPWGPRATDKGKAKTTQTRQQKPAATTKRTRVTETSSRWAILSRPGIQAAFLFSFICLFAINSRTTFLPVYMQQLGTTSTVIGVLMAIGSLGQAALRPFTADALRLFGLPGVLVGASLLGVAGFFVLPLFTSHIVIALLMLIHGAGAGLQQSVGLLMLAEHSTEQERGFAVGLRATANQISSTAAPATLGLLIQRTGVTGGFAINGLALALLIVVMGMLAVKTERLQQRQAEPV